MKYKTIFIEPNIGRKRWTYRFKSDETDRVEKETIPNANGFYTYPNHINDEVSFNRLKRCMIQRHKKAIRELYGSMRLLMNLKFKRR